MKRTPPYQRQGSFETGVASQSWLGHDLHDNNATAVATSQEWRSSDGNGHCAHGQAARAAVQLLGVSAQLNCELV